MYFKSRAIFFFLIIRPKRKKKSVKFTSFDFYRKQLKFEVLEKVQISRNCLGLRINAFLLRIVFIMYVDVLFNAKLKIK